MAQLFEIRPTHKKKDRKRVGRGGKRGTYSGHGSKGQKSRAGTRIRPGFRGGDNPIWKLFPKQRGAGKRLDVKNNSRLHQVKPVVVNLSAIDGVFQSGSDITPKTLFKHGLVSTTKNGVKILGDGNLTKKFTFTGLLFSNSAKEKVKKLGSVIK